MMRGEREEVLAGTSGVIFVMEGIDPRKVEEDKPVWNEGFEGIVLGLFCRRSIGFSLKKISIKINSVVSQDKSRE